ncbi:hypothetical protein [Halobaculum sp. EA56]|uniref:hypothetical protein n=1 Tax=Halobaculum sp. EA56 TaxID=3421648 RepID=UPI003EBB7587
MRPTQPYRALRAGAGALVLASGYAVFGRRTMSAAVDEAQELTDGSDPSGGDSDGNA